MTHKPSSLSQSGSTGRCSGRESTCKASRSSQAVVWPWEIDDPIFLSSSKGGAQVSHGVDDPVISWDSPGKLQSTTALRGSQSVGTDDGTTSPKTITTTGTAKFYRVMAQ